MKIFSLISFFISIVCVAEAQNISGCYTYRSSYYEGDFKKICLREDYTFTYIFHQNDVIGDYISSGNWWRQNDSIYFKSIEKPNITQYGNDVQQKVNIQLKDTINDSAIFFHDLAIRYKKHTLINGVEIDSTGFVSIDLDSITHIAIRTIMYGPVSINVSDIKKENMIVYLDRNRFKDVSSVRLLYKPKTKSLIEVKNKNTIYYPLDLSNN